MKLLIDGDILVYRAAWAAQHTEHQIFSVGADSPLMAFRYKKEMKQWLDDNDMEEGTYDVVPLPIIEPVKNALYSVKHMINNMLTIQNTNDYVIFLTGKGNYREQLDPEYKANRKDLEKPEHYAAVREYLTRRWDAITVDGMEADDAMGLAQDATTVICTIDKDLDVVPGWHYNFVKDALYEVHPEDADYFFFAQVLTGDRTDNIKGLDGVGPATAKKMLLGATTTEEMAEVVRIEYQNAYGDNWEVPMELAKSLLWIRQDREMP